MPQATNQNITAVPALHPLARASYERETIASLGGRRGWLGAWRRFEYMDPVAGKPYWTAAKVLTESPLDIQPLRAKMGQFRFQVILSF